MGNWYNPFSWFKTETQQVNNTKRSRRSPGPVDWTDSMQVNSVLTKGLYHNTYPGLKLAGFGYNFIAIPVSFMGLPIPKTESETVQEQINTIVKAMTDKLKDIHIQAHREGTIWIWPKFSKNKLIWEFIPDDVVTDIIRDISSGEVIKIITSEEITLSVGDGVTTTINRKRTFTRTKVTIDYTGDIPASLRGKVQRNPAHTLPIPFANNADGGISRGHSDYERVLSDLKNYHDCDLAESTILAKFSPKMVVDHVTDIDKYAENQGYEDASDMFENIEIGNIDLILNSAEEEVDFVIPEGATESLRKKLQQIFHKLVQISGVPEIVLGLNMTGNHASVEEQMASLMKYVEEKRLQKTAPYKTLFVASLSLLFTTISEDDLEIEWNQLDCLSDKVKSDVYKNFAEGTAAIIKTAGLTKKQLWGLWRKNFPAITEEEFEEFETGLTAMSGFVVRTNSTLGDVLLSQGDKLE